jgi:hypothetical protein
VVLALESCQDDSELFIKREEYFLSGHHVSTIARERAIAGKNGFKKMIIPETV